MLFSILATNQNPIREHFTRQTTEHAKKERNNMLSLEQQQHYQQNMKKNNINIDLDAASWHVFPVLFSLDIEHVIQMLLQVNSSLATTHQLNIIRQYSYLRKCSFRIPFWLKKWLFPFRLSSIRCG